MEYKVNNTENEIERYIVDELYRVRKKYLVKQYDNGMAMLKDRRALGFNESTKIYKNGIYKTEEEAKEASKRKEISKILTEHF